MHYLLDTHLDGWDGDIESAASQLVVEDVASPTHLMSTEAKAAAVGPVTMCNTFKPVLDCAPTKTWFRTLAGCLRKSKV